MAIAISFCQGVGLLWVVTINVKVIRQHLSAERKLVHVGKDACSLALQVHYKTLQHMYIQQSTLNCLSSAANALRKCLLEGALEPLDGVVGYAWGHLVLSIVLHIRDSIALLPQVARILHGS